MINEELKKLEEEQLFRKALRLRVEDLVKQWIQNQKIAKILWVKNSVITNIKKWHKFRIETVKQYFDKLN